MGKFIEVEDEDGRGRMLHVDNIVVVVEHGYGKLPDVVMCNGEIIQFKAPSYQKLADELLERT